MPLIQRGVTSRFNLPAPGEWVDIPIGISRGDEIALQQEISRRSNPFDEDGNRKWDFVIGIEAREFTELEMFITGWSFDAPVTPENIRSLDPASVAAIKRELVNRKDHATEAELGNSEAPSSTP